jgi:hypothetical protein
LLSQATGEAGRARRNTAARSGNGRECIGSSGFGGRSVSAKTPARESEIPARLTEARTPRRPALTALRPRATVDAMAPPLLPSTRLLSCPACAEHVKAHETACPHCGAEIGGSRLASTAAAVLMGLALSACPGKGNDSDTATSTMSTGTGDSTTGNSTGGSESSTTDAVTSSGTTQLPEPEYGVPVTETTAEPDYGVPSTTGTTGETDPSSGGEPEYGVPQTTGTTAEPDYGVPGTTSSTTTAEPDYGVPGTTGTTG